MSKQQLDSISVQTPKQFLQTLDMWKFIIENSLEYYKSGYPEFNGKKVKYEENKEKGDADTIDTWYKRFNDLEYTMTSLMTQTEEAAYREQNRIFFHFLFTSKDSNAIVNKFTALLQLNASTSYSDEVKKAASVREIYYNTLVEKDNIFTSPSDLVMRYKRIYLLRKQTFHSTLKLILNESKSGINPRDFDELKVLFEKNVDYALSSADQILESILNAPPETLPSETLLDAASDIDTIKEIQREIENTKKRLKEDYNVQKTTVREANNVYDGIKEQLRQADENPETTENQKQEIRARLANAETALQAAKDAKYKLIKESGDKIDKLKKVLDYETEAMSARDKIKLHFKSIPDRAKAYLNEETAYNMSKYMAQKSAGFVIRLWLDKPKPSFGDFAEELLKDITPKAGVFLATFLLGPVAGGIAAPFITELFSFLWGSEKPVDPNKARFDHIDEELERINARLDDIVGKLDGINNKLDDLITMISEVGTDIDLKLKISNFKEKVLLAKKTLNNFKDLYADFYKPYSMATPNAKGLLKMDNDLRSIIEDLVIAYWDTDFKMSAHDSPFKISPATDTIAYALNQFAQNENSKYSSFDKTIDTILPLVGAIVDVSQTYMVERIFILQMLAATYTLQDYEDKEDTFDIIFKNISDMYSKFEQEKARLTNVMCVLNTYGKVSPDIWQFYDNYIGYTHNPKALNISHAFCLETFNPKDEKFVSKPIFYNYNTASFEEHPEGKYARFFLVSNTKTKGEFLLHCVNENFDQRYVSVKLGLRTGPDNELVLLNRTERHKWRIRLVPLTDERFDKSYKLGLDKVVGELDCFLASKKTISIDDNRILVKLPLEKGYFSIIRTHSGFCIGPEFSWYKEIKVEAKVYSLTFRPIDKGNGFEIVGTDSGKGIQFSGYENPIPELGIFDMEIQHDNERYLYDNRYFRVQKKSENENRLEAYGKLTAMYTETIQKGNDKTDIVKEGKSLKNGAYQLKFGDKAYKDVLKLESSPINTHWYAGIENDSSTPDVKGKLAVMQPDGNFVVIDEEGKIVWQTNTGGKGKDVYLELLSDRTLVVAVPDKSNFLFPYRILWQAGIRHQALTYGLQVGESLRKGEFRTRRIPVEEKPTFENGEVKLILEHDGNLRLLFIANYKSDKLPWVVKAESKTNTVDKMGEYVVFEPKKGLVIYDKNDKAIWAGGGSVDHYKKLTALGYLELDIHEKGMSHVGKISIQDGKGKELDSFWDWKY
jgi:hypothetical protein